MAYPATPIPEHIGPAMPEYPKEVTVYKNQAYSSRSLSGVIYTIPLRYNPMTAANYAVLLAHFASMGGVQGLAFSWTHPRSSVVYTVKYSKFEPVAVQGLDPHASGSLLGMALNVEFTTAI